ncbi:hypothetical protein JCM16358_25370 [Halanaerocella petrolearia]
MGWFSSACSVVNDACSAVKNCISEVASSIGSAVSSFAKKLVVGVPEVAIIAEVISAVIKVIAKELGLVEEEETPEELGAKAVESEKGLEDFSSTEEYIEHLRTEVELDMEEFNNMGEEERLACSAIGISVLSKGIEEEKEITIPEDFWVEVGKQDMKAEEVKAYIENFKDNDSVELNLGDYLKGNLSVRENKETSSVIEDTLRELNPDLSDEDIQDRIFEMKQVSREVERG